MTWNFTDEELKKASKEISKIDIKELSAFPNKWETILITILSHSSELYCDDCLNSEYEGKTESSPMGPAEGGYSYCGLNDEKKDLIGAECFEMHDCDASKCVYFSKKSAQLRFKEFEERWDVLSTNTYRRLGLRKRLLREIVEEKGGV